MKTKLFLLCAVALFCLSVMTCGGESTPSSKPGGPFPVPHNCASCHKFDETKFEALMSGKKVSVINYEMVDGLWQVLCEPTPGQRVVIYVSPKYDKIFYGQVFGKNGENYTRQYMLNHAAKIDTSSIPAKDAVYVMGSKEAENKIFVFDDLECPYCARLHFELKSFIADHKDYAAYVMLFPLPIHKNSEEKSEAVYCLRTSKEKEDAVERLFKGLVGNKVLDLTSKKKCQPAGLERVKHYGAETLKIKGTPLLVLPDGRVIEGFVTKKELEGILAGKVAQTAVPVSLGKNGNIAPASKLARRNIN